MKCRSRECRTPILWLVFAAPPRRDLEGVGPLMFDLLPETIVEKSMKLRLLFWLIVSLMGHAPCRADHDVQVTGATSGSVWGSDPYTSDSNLGVAAVHLGILSPGQTAWIHVRELGPRSSFSGSFRNGVATSNWGSSWEAIELSLVPIPNHAPTCSIVGSTQLIVGQPGTWTYSGADVDGNLVRWRVSLAPNVAQWSAVSGSSNSASFSYAFSSVGTYVFNFTVEDSQANSVESSITINVTETANTPPQINTFAVYPSSAMPGDTVTIHLGASDGEGNMNAYAVRHVGWGGINPGGVGAAPPDSQSFSSNFSYTIPTGLPAGTHVFRAEVGDTCSVVGSATTYGIQEFQVTVFYPSNPDPTYVLSVENGLGSASGLPGHAQVLVAAQPSPSQLFLGWSVINGSGAFQDSSRSQTTFTMNGTDATVRAEIGGINHAPIVTIDGPAIADLGASPWVIRAYDINANLARARVRIDGTGDWQLINGGSFTASSIPELSPGTHTLAIEAVDESGALASTNLTVQIIDSVRYSVAVENGSGGGEGLLPGTLLTLSCELPAGHIFGHWEMISSPDTGVIASPNSSSTDFLVGNGNAVVRAITLPTPSAIPAISISASQTMIYVGGVVNFSVSASCASGLCELGLEACDESGTPLAMVGAVAVKGGTASFAFNWSTPAHPNYFESETYPFWASSPGIYYFAAYAWNADGSHRTRSELVAVRVSFEINANFEGWIVQSWNVPLAETVWTAWDPRTEGGIQFTGVLPNVPAPADDSWNTFGEILEEIEAERNERDQRLNEAVGAAETARLNSQIDAALAKGKGVKLVDPTGKVVRTILPSGAVNGSGTGTGTGTGTGNGGNSSGGNSNFTATTVYVNSGTAGAASSGSDFVPLPAFVIYSNDPETFDWQGYYAWHAQNGVPYRLPPLAPGGLGQSANATNAGAGMRFPYSQIGGGACAVASVRTILHMLGVNPVPSEAEVRRIMAQAAGIPEANFDNSQLGLSQHQLLAINDVLGRYGFRVEQKVVHGYDDLSTKLESSEGGMFLAARKMLGGSVQADVNHMVAGWWTGYPQRVALVYDPAVPPGVTTASSRLYWGAEELSKIVPHSFSQYTGEYQTGWFYFISKVSANGTP